MSDEQATQTQDVSRETQDSTPMYKRDSGGLKFEATPVNPYAPMAHANAQSVASATEAMTGGQPEQEQEAQPEQTEQATEAVEEPEVKQEAPPVSRSAAELNRLAKEKAELRREKAELEKLRQQTQPKPELSMDEFKKLAQENPVELARKLGVDEREFYNLYTDKILRGDETPEQAHIKKLEAQLTEFKNKFETKEQEEARLKAEQATTNFRNTIRSHIDSNKEKYELIYANDASDTVFEVVRQYYDQTEKLLSLDEASQIVENQLEEDLSSRLQKLAKVKKIQKLGLFKDIAPESSPEVQPASSSAENKNTIEPAQEDPAKQFAEQRKMNRTITNQMVGQSTINNRPLTREERMREAAKLLTSVKQA